jgi:cardiolipin synthase
MNLPEDTGTEITLIGAGLILVSVIARVLALGVIPGNRRPSSGMAWLLLVLLSPVAGIVAFSFFGTTRVGRRRHLHQHEVNQRIAAAAAWLPEVAEDLRPAIHSVAALNRALGALPVTPDNTVEVLADYSGSIRAMTAAVERAEEYVDVEFYITAWDDVTGPFFQALIDAATRGVKVRLLFDHLGTRGIPGYRDLLHRLRQSPIEWHAMLPIRPLRGRFRRPDLRNHRKLLVVDGRVGFTGSQNLVEPGYNKPRNHAVGRQWVELMVRLGGPVVAELEAVFASDWLFETDVLLPVTVRPGDGVDAEGAGDAVVGVSAQVVPSGPGFVTENNLRMFTTLIYAATERISLTSPYFVPDESLLYAVTTAAQRGVDVELFVSEESDQFMVGHAQASFYRALLEAGVRIHLYPAPYVLHSKHFTVDHDVAVIGSSNMDMRSFALNYEISVMLLGEEVVDRIKAVEDAYRAQSRLLTLEEWRRRPARTRYVDNVMRLTSALQ